MSIPAVGTQNPYWDAVQAGLAATRARSSLYRTTHGRDEQVQAAMMALSFPRWDVRERLCRQYAWAIPDPESVAFVAAWLGKRAVEMGAGTGYWAWQLSQLGCDIVAYDARPPDRCCENGWHSPYQADAPSMEELFLGETIPVFFEIVAGTPGDLVQHGDRALFLCWPPHELPMAAECLACYPGTRLVYIGEDRGGWTGDAAFFDRLFADWREIASHRPRQWWGVHDWIRVFEKEGSA